MYTSLNFIKVNPVFRVASSITISVLYVNQIRNNGHFKRKIKELLIKECYYSTEECMNEVFINIGF
jgi:hypothetical protein